MSYGPMFCIEINACVRCEIKLCTVTLKQHTLRAYQFCHYLCAELVQGW